MPRFCPLTVVPSKRGTVIPHFAEHGENMFHLLSRFTTLHDYSIGTELIKKSAPHIHAASASTRRGEISSLPRVSFGSLSLARAELPRKSLLMTKLLLLYALMQFLGVEMAA